MTKFSILLAMAMLFLVSGTTNAAPMVYELDLYDGPPVTVDADNPFIIGTVDFEQEFQSIDMFDMKFWFDETDRMNMGETYRLTWIDRVWESTYSQTNDAAAIGHYVHQSYFGPVDPYLDGVIEDVKFEMLTGSVKLTDVIFTIEQGTTVPIPSAIWLLGSAFIGLVGFRKKIRRKR